MLVRFVDLDLDGKVAIVTGGGRGIGRATAIALAKHGAKLGIAARTISEIEEVKSEILKDGGKCLAIVCDVSKEENVNSMIDTVVKNFGRLDIMVCNAAVIHGSLNVVDMSLEEWKRVIDINLTGVFLSCKAAMRQMIKQRDGKIVIVSSIGGKKGMKGRSAYRASKAALLNFTESLSGEAKEYGINVNCVNPGPVETKMIFDANPNVDRMTLMKPEEIANVILYLVGEQSKAIYGAIIDVAGQKWEP